ncbi:MAG: patatin-like phospholipase family protein [Cyclobacteriaceae bacterium]
MNQKFRILSIDGGGIRGIIPGQIMAEIEREFGIIPADHFDLIAGTSTGGILTCGYLIPSKDNSNTPKFSAKEVVGLYLDRGDEIFDVPFYHKVKSGWGILDEKFPEDELENALKEYFGDVWLKDLLKPCLIPSYDIRRRKGHFFGQHKAADHSMYNFKVRDVARATSAAPTYFEASKIESEVGDVFPLIDGGVFVNNPALAAYAEGRNIFELNDGERATAADMKILSLGTGFTRQKYSHSKAKNWGKAEWVQPIIDIMMSGSSEVADYQLRKIFETTNSPEQYLRINGDLRTSDINPDLGCATQENMKKLKAYGIELFHHHSEKIEAWLKL